MTLLRMRELRQLPDEDLDRKIAEIESDLLRERGVAAMGGAPASPGHLRALRTDLARALTVKTERRRAAPPPSGRTSPRPSSARASS